MALLWIERLKDRDKVRNGQEGSCLRLKQRDRGFSQYYAEFQRYVADDRVECKDAPIWTHYVEAHIQRTKGLATTIVQSQKVSLNVVKLYSKRDSRVKKTCGRNEVPERWEGSEKSEAQRPTHAYPGPRKRHQQGTVAGYRGPGANGCFRRRGEERRSRRKERKRHRGRRTMYATVGIAHVSQHHTPRKLKAASGRSKYSPFRKAAEMKDNADSELKGKERRLNQEKFGSSAIKMAIVLETNFLCQLMLVLVFRGFTYQAQK